MKIRLDIEKQNGELADQNAQAKKSLNPKKSKDGVRKRKNKEKISRKIGLCKNACCTKGGKQIVKKANS